MSYFWTDFASLEALTHNPVHRVAIALIHLNIKRIWDDSLFDGQQTLMNNDSQAYLLYFMWLVSSHFVEIKRKASDGQPAQIWAEIFEVNQTSFISAVNSQKSLFPFCTCCICLSQVCAAALSMHTTGTNDTVISVWTLTPPCPISVYAEHCG